MKSEHQIEYLGYCRECNAKLYYSHDDSRYWWDQCNCGSNGHDLQEFERVENGENEI